MDIWHYLLIGGALVMVIEGLLYALFPNQLQKIIAMVIEMPPEKIRAMGDLTLALGALFLWLLIH